MWLLVLLVLNDPFTDNGKSFNELFYFATEEDCKGFSQVFERALIYDGKLKEGDFVLFCVDEGNSI